MFHTTRYALISLVVVLFVAVPLLAQPPAVPLPIAGQQPVQIPPGFELNALQQAALDRVLDAWQVESGKIVTFKCAFERWDYNAAFGPGQKIPLNKDKGEVSYQRPDKGSFQITEINVFQAPPVPPGQQPPAQPQGTWVKQPNAIGEHWVCDGKSVFEYRHDQKQLVERPIPPHLQGQAIADGPLPFLFGADAAKLKQRYWIRIEQEKDHEIWLVAKPRHQAQAADFTQVEVMLDRQRLLPNAMQVHMPNGSRHVYIFDIANASVNSTLARLQALFERPRTPVGWKRVVEDMPVAQAAQPVQPAR
ncbi:MAG: TIGR03009 domain-containing protein [Pirellulales bacterium]